jgi:hypothetical protein
MLSLHMCMHVHEEYLQSAIEDGIAKAITASIFPLSTRVARLRNWIVNYDRIVHQVAYLHVHTHSYVCDWHPTRKLTVIEADWQ